MTLHVGLLHGAFVLQVGDRLLTQGDAGSAVPWDAYANKTIIVLATNGTVAVSYAGLAHIEAKPTDQCIAEAIAGHSFIPGVRGGLATGHVAGFRVSVKQAFEGTRDLLESKLANEPVSPASRRISVLISGWTWKRRARWGTVLPRPIASIIRHDGKAGAQAELQSLPRTWRWDQTLQVPHIGADVGSRKADLLAELAAPKKRTNSDIESAFVDWIRTIASDPKGDVVGTDCMAVCISRSQEVTVNFHRDTTLATPMVAYTPFVIGRGILAPPSVLTGSGFSLHAGGVDIPFSSIPPLPDGGLFEMYGQPRRPLA